MALVKCYECGNEISITARGCPKCGSKKAFKGYSFTRNELVERGVTSPMDFMNYTDNGGDIKGKKWLYFKIAISIFIIYVAVNHFIFS